jgi:hypothetical protein
MMALCNWLTKFLKMSHLALVSWDKLLQHHLTSHSCQTPPHPTVIWALLHVLPGPALASSLTTSSPQIQWYCCQVLITGPVSYPLPLNLPALLIGFPSPLLTLSPAPVFHFLSLPLPRWDLHPHWSPSLSLLLGSEQPLGFFIFYLGCVEALILSWPSADLHQGLYSSVGPCGSQGLIT